jgi:nitrate/nitrite transport system permease protein
MSTIAPTLPAAIESPVVDESLARPRGALAGTAKRFASQVGWACVGFGVLVALWQVASWRITELPTPAATLTELRSLLADPFHDGGVNDQGIGRQLLSSLGRVFSGFAMAAAIGVPLGMLIGASRRAWMAANPVIQLLRPVSPLAWFPIWLVAFKDAPRAAVWVIFITALWPIVINTAAGAASVPKDQRNVAKVFKLDRLAYVRHVLVPHTLPSIVTGLRLSMGVAWMVIVAVEMLSGGVGVGFFVWDAYNALNLAKVVSAIVVIGVVGLVLDALFLRLSKAVQPEVM